MLNAKVLPQILKQAHSPGIISAIIVTTGGDLLATSSGASNDKLIAAIVVNIWSAYSKFGDKTDLGFLLLDCEEGRVAVSSASPQFLICVYGDTKVEQGMLKAKVQALKQYLAPQLSQLV